MAFNGMVVTNSGRIALTKAQNGGELKFESVGIGDGVYSGSYNDISLLSNQLFETEIKKIDIKDDICVLEIDISNAGLKVGYYLREIGIYAMDGGKKVLYAYTNAGNDAEYIQADSSVCIEKRIRLSLIVSGAANINTEVSSVLYVTEQDFNGALKGKLDYTVINSSTAIADLGIGVYFSAATGNFTDAPAEAAGECTVFVQKANKAAGVGQRAVLTDSNKGIFVCDDKTWVKVKDFTAAKDTKLAGIAEGANKYIHPSSHAASMITQDATHRFVTDTEKNKVAKLQADGTVIRYGVCNTGSSTEAKTVSISGFSLITGAKITVRFECGITCDYATLNVSGSGAKPIYYRGRPLRKNYILSERVLDLLYTESSWEVIGGLTEALDGTLWRGDEYKSFGFSSHKLLYMPGGCILAFNGYYEYLTNANALDLYKEGAFLVGIKKIIPSSSTYISYVYETQINKNNFYFTVYVNSQEVTIEQSEVQQTSYRYHITDISILNTWGGEL